VDEAKSWTIPTGKLFAGLAGKSQREMRDLGLVVEPKEPSESAA
jgi:hypothetical protein